VHRAGEAVAALQGVPAAGVPVGLRQHADDLLRPGPGDWDAVPVLAGRAGRLLEVLLHAEQPVPARWVHRDLHPRQVLDDGRRTWLVDWEHAAAGDPALDVGNLCGYLRARLAPAAAEAAVSAFRAGYACGDRDGALRRAALFEAFTCLRLACKAARPHTGDPGTADRLLTRALRVADEVGLGERA
jgi:aminoglycoside phosphotransferase (APT) family kinase protein